MQYYIISNPEPVNKEFDIINHLLKNNTVTFHLRKPSFTKKEMSDFLNNISKDLHSQIVIHSHHSLIQEYELKGIHFTHHNKVNIPDYENTKCSKSISTHSVEEINSYSHSLNYFFLSPIFQSISKPGYGGTSFNYIELKDYLKAEYNKNIVALGGVNANTISQVKKLGFTGAAILGTFWQHCDSIDNLSDMNLFFESLNLNQHS